MFKIHSRLLLIAMMLVTCEILAAAPLARATNPAIFITPSTVIGDLTPTPGSVTQWKVNVSDIEAPGLIGHEFYIALDPRAFPEYKPIGNSNFTANANGWTTTISGTPVGTATYGWDGTDGNPTPGSGTGSYYVKATASATQPANIIFFTEYSFSWPGGTPPDLGALSSFAFKISGNSIGTNLVIQVVVVKPDLTTATLVNRYYSAIWAWSYNYTTASSSAFSQSGTYKLRLRATVKTLASGTSNYAQVNWDDAGLLLARVTVTEGPFLTSDSRNVGKTVWTTKYVRSAANSSVYVVDSLMGTPWTDIWPVQGGGTIAYISITANYGAAYLDLWGTKLLEPSLVPPYSPVEIPHDTIDAYFDNRIPGDIAGPESPPASGLYPYDGNVNNYDLTYLRMKFGTNDPKADFTGPENPPGSGTYPPDGIVNVRDLQPIGKNYGRHYP